MATWRGFEVINGSPHKMIDTTLIGGAQCKANLAAWIEKAPDKVARAYYDEMVSVMEESKTECPWDYTNDHKDGSPHMRDTARVDSEVDGDKLITYGSYHTPYAVYVHEILEYHHLAPTKAKFLEDPVNRREKVLLGNILDRMGNFYEGIGTSMVNFSKTIKIASNQLRRDSPSQIQARKAATQRTLGHLGGRFI